MFKKSGRLNRTSSSNGHEKTSNNFTTFFVVKHTNTARNVR